MGEWSRIDMSVSPIRDEFTAIPGTPISRNIQYTNNSNAPYLVYITTEDCVPSGDYGTPICKKQTGTWTNPEFSSTWIHIDGDTTFTVPPKWSRTITYTVNAPTNAAPGGHYGAIFFNNPDTLDPGANSVGMIRRIWTLYMMKIPGEIRVDTELGDILVDGPGGWIGNGTTWWDNGFNSAPNFLDTLIKKWQWKPMWEEIIQEMNPLWDKPMLEKDNFAVTLKVPVKNDGNIHVKPTGKVYLYEDDGKQLEKIGKESIVDENGVYLWERIVDYLPINDEQWSVLPNTERVYQVNWLGFGYEERDPKTNEMWIKFETPRSYYSRLTEENAQFIYPWEKLAIRKMDKTLTAKVEFTYNDITKNENVTRTMDVPVKIAYTYIAKTLNYGMLTLVGFILFFAWIFIRKRDKRIEKLESTNHELSDEITVLEKAKNTIPAKKRKVPQKEEDTVLNKEKEEKITETKKKRATRTKKEEEATKDTPIKKPRTTTKKKISENSESPETKNTSL